MWEISAKKTVLIEISAFYPQSDVHLKTVIIYASIFSFHIHNHRYLSNSLHHVTFSNMKPNFIIFSKDRSLWFKPIL
jgi:hypothetical protein